MSYQCNTDTTKISAMSDSARMGVFSYINYIIVFAILFAIQMAQVNVKLTGCSNDGRFPLSLLTTVQKRLERWSTEKHNILFIQKLFKVYLVNCVEHFLLYKNDALKPHHLPTYGDSHNLSSNNIVCFISSSVPLTYLSKLYKKKKKKKKTNKTTKN